MAKKASKKKSKDEEVMPEPVSPATPSAQAGRTANEVTKKKKKKKKKKGGCCFGGSAVVSDDEETNKVGGTHPSAGGANSPGGYSDPTKGFAIPKGYTRFKNIDE